MNKAQKKMTFLCAVKSATLSETTTPSKAAVSRGKK